MLDIENIVKRLVEARGAYYGSGHTVMTDEEYDSLEALLKKQDPENPFFETIGHPVSSAWKKADHSTFMGSLEKVNTEEEFRKWVLKFEKDVLLCMQFKLDGLSLSLDYEMSQFIRGITRGNGTTGENISDNVILMKGFREKGMTWSQEILVSMSKQGFIDDMKPSEYPGIFQDYSIRAEILLSKEDFAKINASLPEKERYANPRNAAAGISRRLDGKYSKYLQIVTYDINKPLDETVKINVLKKLGFYTPVQYIGKVEEIIKNFEVIKNNRDKLPYGIDGVVVKAVSHEIQEAMGVTKNKPKAQKAWKFDPPGEATPFIKEEWNVGRTGVVTPLAHLEPVEIDGSIIKKATLHNVAEIKRLGIGRGDTVMLVKRGDIIPKIESVLKHEGKPIEIPTRCPSCKDKLENDGITLKCVNDNCLRKEFYRILNWIKVVEIDTFGESLAEELFGMGLLCSIADIYRLSKVDISGIERWGEKSANTVIQNIGKTKNLTPEKFLCALGIPSISESTSAELLQAFETLENLMKQDIDSIKKLKGFSDISAKKVVEGLAKNKKEIDYLLTVITLGDRDDNKGTLSGLSFCFTGKMKEPRSHYQKIVTLCGGENKKSVVKDLTYLVCNEDMGSSKSMKAKKYGVKVIKEKEFLELAGHIEPEPEEPEPTKLIEDCGSLFDEE